MNVRRGRMSIHALWLPAGLLAVWTAASIDAGAADAGETSAAPVFGMRNPAAFYCRELGYDYETVATPDGERGVCVLPDGRRADAWDFFRGKCAEEYSYCARLGHRTETRTTDTGDCTMERAVCVARDGTELGTVWDLMEFDVRLAPLTAGRPFVEAPSSRGGGGRGALLPESFDWRDYDGVTSIKDQRFCGSCWAHSAVAVLESAVRIKDGVDTDLSEQWLVSCNQDGWNCIGGWWAHRYHQWKTDLCDGTGGVFEDDYPYTALDLPCVCPVPHPYLIDLWGHIAGREVLPTVDEIKEALLEFGPLDVSVFIDDAFSEYTTGIFRTCDNTWYPNHTVTLVGWDDNQGIEGIWFIKNSWGTGWGEDGYMRIEYECSNIGFGGCWVRYADPLTVRPADPVPPVLVPEEATPVAVVIEERSDGYVPGTGFLHYRYGGGDFLTAELVQVEGDLYEAVLPPADCDDAPEFYLSASGARFGEVTSPARAPDELHRSHVGLLATVFADDFEEHRGWTVSDGDNLIDGSWERGVPVGGGDRGDPPTDYDGSGSCYLTGNEDGDSDVDGGATRLISRRIDIGPADDVIVRYALWYTNCIGNNPNEDVLRVYLRGTGNWTLVDAVGPETPLPIDWHEYSFAVGDLVDWSTGLTVRFDASEDASGSVVEAGLDAFSVSALVCDASGVADDAASTRQLALEANRPNPFSAETRISFSLPREGRVELSVYDAAGRLVRTLLASELRPAGEQTVAWDGRDGAGRSVAAGAYFCRLTADGEVVTKKMVLLR
jgi:putative hemolysin